MNTNITLSANEHSGRVSGQHHPESFANEASRQTQVVADDSLFNKQSVEMRN